MRPRRVCCISIATAGAVAGKGSTCPQKVPPNSPGLSPEICTKSDEKCENTVVWETSESCQDWKSLMWLLLENSITNLIVYEEYKGQYAFASVILSTKFMSCFFGFWGLRPGPPPVLHHWTPIGTSVVPKTPEKVTPNKLKHEVTVWGWYAFDDPVTRFWGVRSHHIAIPAPRPF